MTAPPPVDLGPTLGVGYIGVGLFSMRVTASISKIYNRTDTVTHIWQDLWGCLYPSLPVLHVGQRPE